MSRYLRRHGVAGTARRAIEELRRRRHFGAYVMYSCNLPPPPSPPDPELTLERLDRDDPERTGSIRTHWNEQLMTELFALRFGLGAHLWLCRTGARLAGYGWTLRGDTVEPYFFPLGPGDVHFFDFCVFPDFRGRRINPRFVNAILHEVGRAAPGRALIECGMWNRAQRRSLSHTPFVATAMARKLRVFGTTFTQWSRFPRD